MLINLSPETVVIVIMLSLAQFLFLYFYGVLHRSILHEAESDRIHLFHLQAFELEESGL